MCSPQSPQSSEDYGDVKKVTVRVVTQSLSQGFYCVKGRSYTAVTCSYHMLELSCIMKIYTVRAIQNPNFKNSNFKCRGQMSCFLLLDSKMN